LYERFRPVLEAAVENDVVFDCEIFSQSLTFQQIGSCLSKAGREIDPSIRLHAFDCVSVTDWRNKVNRPYHMRLSTLKDVGQLITPAVFEVVDQVECKTPNDVKNVFNLYEEMGEEGIMLRSVDGHYKHGRATVNQCLIYKFKVSATADAQIIGFQTGTTTKKDIDREVDAFGHRKFAGKKDDRVEVDRLGGIYVRLEDGTECTIGIAAKYSDEEFPDGNAIWRNRDSLIGQWVEFEYMPVGVKDKPRWGRMTRIRRDKTGDISSPSEDEKSSKEASPAPKKPDPLHEHMKTVVDTFMSKPKYKWTAEDKERDYKRRLESEDGFDIKITTKDLLDTLMKDYLEKKGGSDYALDA
jgi:hypothetical protein